jgi:hypothetical protein
VLLAALLLAKLFEDGRRDQMSKRNGPRWQALSSIKRPLSSASEPLFWNGCDFLELALSSSLYRNPATPGFFMPLL